MPRSNKKKKVANIPSSAQSTGEPPPGSLTQTHDNQISLLFSEETAIMISRYRYNRQDMPYLISSQDVREEDEKSNKIRRGNLKGKDKPEEKGRNEEAENRDNDQFRPTTSKQELRGSSYETNAISKERASNLNSQQADTKSETKDNEQCTPKKKYKPRSNSCSQQTNAETVNSENSL